MTKQKTGEKPLKPAESQNGPKTVEKNRLKPAESQNGPKTVEKNRLKPAESQNGPKTVEKNRLKPTVKPQDAEAGGETGRAEVREVSGAASGV